MCCDSEIISTESGITFSWPKALGGETATFTCPENGSHNLVMRNCTSNGLWQPFPEKECGVNTDGQLDGQNTSFTKVRLHIQQLYPLLKCVASYRRDGP